MFILSTLGIGINGGLQNLCTAMTRLQVNKPVAFVYVVVSCAAKQSNSGEKGAEVVSSLMVALLLIGTFCL